MDLLGHVPGAAPLGAVNPGATTPAPYNVAHTGAIDGTGPGSATKNMAEIYNRDLLWRRALIASAGLAFDPTNWVQEVQAIQAIIAGAALSAVGQCRLSKSGANLILLPYNGNKIMVNGVLCTVPDAGVTLAPPAVASTTYNIYAVATASVITSLEASVTAHSTDVAAGANKGVEIKTGDATRSLVGMARTTAAKAWVDSDAQRFVRTWFNRESVGSYSFLTATAATGSAGYVELSTDLRINFLVWAGEVVSGGYSGDAYSSAPPAYIRKSIAFNGIIPEAANSQAQSPPAGIAFNLSAVFVKTELIEGLNYVTNVVSTTGGTASFTGDAVTINRNSMSIRIGG